MSIDTQEQALAEARKHPCEVGMCFFIGDINLGGKWVCQYHAAAEASYYGKHGKPYRDAAFADAGRKQDV